MRSGGLTLSFSRIPPPIGTPRTKVHAGQSTREIFALEEFSKQVNCLGGVNRLNSLEVLN